MAGEEHIVGKIVMEGEMSIESPLLIGDGMSGMNHGNDKDIHVLKDKEGRAIIPGTSLVGVLRECFDRRFPSRTAMLFGDMEKCQSTVQVNDIAYKDVQVVFRDGVKIDSYLGTAVTGAKYDYEAMDRGISAPFRIVFHLRGLHTEKAAEWQKSGISKDVLEEILFLKDRLEEGVHLGAMTAKGFGLVKAKNVKMGLYDFAKKQDVKLWLTQEVPSAAKASVSLDRKSSLGSEDLGAFTVSADFALKSSLLIRDYGLDAKGKSISVMLKSGKDAVIPGTTLKGVLRHRAEYILESTGRDVSRLDGLMGTSESVTGKADTEGRVKSRLLAEETYIDLSNKQIVEKEHTKNRIDRFTGGTIDSALFTTKPLWQKDKKKPTLKIKFSIEKATEEEAGLALFLLKDLWQGKISFGGEAGSGRGTLQGITAEIGYQGEKWKLSENGKIERGNRQLLERYAKAFCEKGV